jgi:hypothetical protein
LTAGPCQAIDLGALTVTVATDRGVTTLPTPPGGPVAAARAALATRTVPATVCVAAPDAWLAGGRTGAASQEDVRHECEDVARTGQVGWTGQLAAVSAFAAVTHGPGRYLSCDVGGTGVRAGVFTVSGATMAIEAIHAEPGGGWRDFDAAVRAGLPPALAPALPATWYEQAVAAKIAARAVFVFEEALSTGQDDELDTQVYQIAGPGAVVDLSARLLIESFEPTQRRLQAAVTSVCGGKPPDHVVLTGGLGWLPLAARTAAIAARVAAEPGIMSADPPGDVAVVFGPDAAARGALRFARGDVSLEPPAGREPVAVPVHRFRDGLLEEVSVTLPWTESFATFPGGTLTVDSEELELSVGGKPRAARLDGLVAGPHLIGLRSAWPGPGVLIVRPAAAGGRPHIVPLADLVARAAR